MAIKRVEYLIYQSAVINWTSGRPVTETHHLVKLKEALTCSDLSLVATDAEEKEE